MIRLLRRGYRLDAPWHEKQDGVEVFRPRFLAFPALFRWLDGLSMALCCYPSVRRLRRQFDVRLIDAHFAHPDGEAAVRLGRWMGLPVIVTLRGTEVPHSKQPRLRQRMERTLRGADRVISVSDSLRQLALRLGAPVNKTEVVGNGIDIERFHAVDRTLARQRFGLPQDAKVMISVGALVERKGMHRVVECMPSLLEIEPSLHYVVVGGASPEGDMSAQLREQVQRLGLSERVHFLGALSPDDLKWPLSAADIFVLATGNEGWANVFLEAMACGLPVVATDVGGNREVVCRAELGTIVPFGDASALRAALVAALRQPWDRKAIVAYARENQWDARVAQLLRVFDRVLEPAPLGDETCAAAEGR
jgi:glycosyltransferase involved in cell wall biosynthesis